MNEPSDSIDDPLAAKKARKPKPYIPKLRSGAYALIMGLSTISEDAPRGLPKDQLIELAQPYCDASFTAPEDPTKFYTAWSSMKTIMQKDYVYEKRGPVRTYSLTDDGWEVARRIKSTVSDDAQTSKETARTTSAHGDRGGFSLMNDQDSSDEGGYPGSRGLTSNTNVDLEQDPYSQWKSPRQRLGTAPVDKFGTFITKRNQPPVEEDFVELLSSPERHPVLMPKQSGRATSDTALQPSIRQSQNTQSRESELGKDTLNGKSDQSASFPSFQPIHLPPGSFIVELVLDNREVRAKNDRDYISSELAKKRVNPFVRPLDIGDAFWIAKIKDPQFLPRRGEEGDEVVLDWIVERKRLDDLIGSIKDGRFHEQKFRLRKSGVKNVIYIIEEITVSQETAIKSHEMVESAIASTQVVNGYFVKKTQKLDDTICYLARMTRMLQTMYEGKGLDVIPSKHLDPQTYLGLLTHLKTPHYVTYPSFSSLASKTDTLTLRDVFLKMLMCTRGITGEKAVEIQKIWKTPKEFVEAFEKCGSAKEREMLVSKKLDGLVRRKKIATTLSKKIAGIWGEA